MGKPKGPKQSQDPPAVEESLLDYPMVKEHLNALQNEGADRQIVLGLLVIFAQLARRTQRHARLVRSQQTRDWADGSGKTAITLKRFASRLDGWAKDIERIDAHPLLDPRLGVHALWAGKPVHVLRSVAHDLRKLPLLVRLRSDLLRSQIHAIEDLLQQARRRHLSFLTSLKLLLIGYTHFSTDRYFLSHIADLLTAAYAVAGTEQTVTVDALTKLWERYPDFQVFVRRVLQQDLDPTLKG